jgi:hypothetical protein
MDYVLGMLLLVNSGFGQVADVTKQGGGLANPAASRG